MSSLVAHHSSLSVAAFLLHGVDVLDQTLQDLRVLKMFCVDGLIGESEDLPADESHRSYVFVSKVLVGDGDGESMASMVFVPSVVSQFFRVKGLVDEETF